MKVYIGPHKNYISVYTLVKPLSFLGEETTIKVAEWLSTTWVSKFLRWLDEKRKRVVKVHIDDYDTWNLDKTLAYIILPCLVKFKTKKHGVFVVDNSDVPKEYRNAPDDDEDNFEYMEKKFEWVVDEMIWAFEQIIDENSEDKFYILDQSSNKFSIDNKGLKEHEKRLERALKLFGKYYRHLWD